MARTPLNVWGGAARYSSPRPTPAPTAWTPAQQQQLANAFAYGYTNPVTGTSNGGHPTWTPPADQNAALPNPIKPVVFDPLNDPGYAAAASQYGYTDPKTGQLIRGSQAEHAGAEYGYTDESGVFHPGYQTHRGAQSFGYDQNGSLVTSGPDLNPYAQAAIMKRNYDITSKGQNNDYASRGLQFSSSYNTAKDGTDFNYGASSDQLKRSAQDFYRGNATAYQGVVDSGTNTLASLLGPAFANFLAGQKGS